MTQFIKICPNKAKNLSKRSDEFDYTYCCLHQNHHASLGVYFTYLAYIKNHTTVLFESNRLTR